MAVLVECDVILKKISLENVSFSIFKFCWLKIHFSGFQPNQLAKYEISSQRWREWAARHWFEECFTQKKNYKRGFYCIRKFFFQTLIYERCSKFDRLLLDEPWYTKTYGAKQANQWFGWTDSAKDAARNSREIQSRLQNCAKWWVPPVYDIFDHFQDILENRKKSRGDLEVRKRASRNKLKEMQDSSDSDAPVPTPKRKKPSKKKPRGNEAYFVLDLFHFRNFERRVKW